MTSKGANPSIEERVASLVEASGKDSVAVERFRDQLIEQWRIYIADIKRNALWSVAAIVGFILFDAHAVGKVTIFSVELTRLTIAPLSFPPLVAYLLLQIWQRVRLVSLVSEAYAKVTSLIQPNLHNSDLDLLVAPSEAPFVPVMPTSLIGDGSESSLNFALRLIQAAVIVIVPVGFWLYAYWQLFAIRSLSDSWAWISLLLTLFIFGVTLASSREDRTRQLGETSAQTLARARRELRIRRTNE
jgi:hypothetical protein